MNRKEKGVTLGRFGGKTSFSGGMHMDEQEAAEKAEEEGGPRV